jgi:acylphosphatase
MVLDVAMDVRARIVVSGRVQGVFYRDSCQRMAIGLGVRGSVRNLRNGDVEVVAEGPREAVDRLADWCRTGPSRAVVTGMSVTDEELTGETNFRVRG